MLKLALKFFNPALIGQLLFLVIASVSFTACSTQNSTVQRIAQRIAPYRITVIQGNFVAREAAAKLQTGMSREQVKEILGTPLLTDLFHQNRWDYIFYFKRGASEIVQQRRLVVYFDGDRLTHFTGGDILLGEDELLAAIDGNKNENTRSSQKKKQ